MVLAVTIEHVLQSRLPRPHSYSPNSVTTTIAQLQQESADSEISNALFDSAVELAGRFEIEASKPRNVGRHRHRP